jgi:hypothetical protein
MIDDERVTVGGMRIGKGNQSTMIKYAPVPLSPPQIPLRDLASNPGRRSGKPATNSLSYGTTKLQVRRQQKANNQSGIQVFILTAQHT